MCAPQVQLCRDRGRRDGSDVGLPEPAGEGRGQTVSVVQGGASFLTISAQPVGDPRRELHLRQPTQLAQLRHARTGSLRVAHTARMTHVAYEGQRAETALCTALYSRTAGGGYTGQYHDRADHRDDRRSFASSYRAERK
jgi:hypothetical protein